MGKVKKKLTPQKSDSQRKISSFFKFGEQQESAAKKSQLFSTSHSVKVRPTSVQNSSASGNSCDTIHTVESEDDEVIFIADSPQTLGNKSSISILGNRSLAQNRSKANLIDIEKTEDSAGSLQNKKVTRDPTSLSTSSTTGSNTTCVPDTQLISSFPSPSGKTDDKSLIIHSDTQDGAPCGTLQAKMSSDGVTASEINESNASIEGDMIPDTPDVADKTVNKRRMPPASRSFLSSSSMLKQPLFPVGLNKSRLKAAKLKQQSARNFEDAYREMMNVGGEPLEKADLSSVIGVLPNAPLTFIKAKEIEKSPRESACEMSPTSIGQSSTDLKNSNNAKASGSKLRMAEAHKPVSAPSVPSGIKRLSNHGESPDAKRLDSRRTPTKLSIEKPHQKAQGGMPCKRKLALSKKGTCKKSESWDLGVSICEKDDVLNDILGELKQETCDTINRTSSSSDMSKSAGREAVISPDSKDGSADIAGQPAADGDVEAVAMDTSEADLMLMDIMSELQQTLTPCSGKTKSVTAPHRPAPIQNLNSTFDSHTSPNITVSKSTKNKSKKSPVKKGPSVMKNKPINLQRTKSLGSKMSDSVVCDEMKQKLVNVSDTSEVIEGPVRTSPSHKIIRESMDLESSFMSNLSTGDGANLSVNESVCDINPRNKTDSMNIDEPVDSENEENKENISTENFSDELCKDFGQLSPFKPPQPVRDLPKKEDMLPLCAHFGRHEVMAIQQSREEIVLDVKGVIDGAQRVVVLQGFWTDVHLSEGDIVHVIGEFDMDGKCYITDKHNLLVVQPDTLVSGTTIVSSLYCMRRSVLSERFKGVDGKNHYMLYGIIIHSFFQMVMQEKATSPAAMKAIASKIVQQTRILHDMYTMGIDEEKVLAEIETYMPHVVKFVEKHASYSAGLASPPPGEVAVMRVADIEENIWSPRYGVKGKIDLTVEVKIHEKPRGWSKKLMPLELKTGKASFSAEHKGQVTLYSMMTSDRRDDPGAGLLLYLRGGSMKTIPADVANQRGLVQLRNEMVHHMLKGLRWSEEGPAWMGGLPAPINSQRACSKCPQLINCALYQKTVEAWHAPEKHAMLNLVPEATDHLTTSHLQYYRKWLELLHREMAAGKKDETSPSEIWCKTPTQREDAGFCISSLVLLKAERVSKLSEPELYCLTFTRKTQKLQSLALNEIGLSQGDSVILSAENKPLIALAQSSISHIAETSVSINADRDLSAYEGEGKLLYRLDKCDSYNIMGINFTNLTYLMQAKASSEKLRQLVIDKRVPEFDVTMSKTKIAQVKDLLKSLNKPQKTAILKVLMCNDYVLIKGYPGTGKTSTIVVLVQALVTLGFSVLLTSYTHSAVDNILLKLRKHNVDFIRLGRRERIHPDIQPHSADHLTANIKTVAELAEFYASKPVVATTCLGVNHAVFSQRVFDICIIDEASQVMQPACLGPLFCSQRFVLVGDPLQLPPVVISRHAREGGMSESLFARLDDTGGTYELNLQYRMNSEIMRLSNELIYSGALKCGSRSVASHRIPSSEQLVSSLTDCEEWIRKALTPEPGHEVVFLDTDEVAMPHVAKDANITNIVEARSILQMVTLCVEAGFSEESFGIITPYRQQVRLIREMLLGNGHLTKIEVNTVDQYQGRDKSIIIVSFVKHSDDGLTSQILKDARRLNVALTRAKHKLIMVGSRKTLTKYEALGKLIQLLRPEQISLL